MQVWGTRGDIGVVIRRPCDAKQGIQSTAYGVEQNNSDVGYAGKPVCMSADGGITVAKAKNNPYAIVLP